VRIFNHEIHEIHEKSAKTDSLDDAFVLELWVVTEVHKETEVVAGCFEVVMNLCTMLVR